MAQNRGNLVAELPSDVFGLCDFLGVQIYSYQNKRTGKMLHHSIGFGRWSMSMLGRNIQIDRSGKLIVKAPDFIYKLSLDESKDVAEKLPHLIKGIDFGNTYSWKPERVVLEATMMYETWRMNAGLDLHSEQTGVGLSADLPPHVFGLSDFLAAEIQTFPNKRTGKMMHHSVTFGKYQMAMKGRNIQIDDITGKPRVNSPEFTFRFMLDEAKETTEKLPHLMKSIELANTFGWDAERLVQEAKDLYQVWQINAQRNQNEGESNVEDHFNDAARPVRFYLNGSTPPPPPIEPTLWQLNGRDSPDEAGPSGCGNSGFAINNDPTITAPWEL